MKVKTIATLLKSSTIAVEKIVNTRSTVFSLPLKAGFLDSGSCSLQVQIVFFNPRIPIIRNISAKAGMPLQSAKIHQY
jgi:hypothetical protein